jgi:hypothetical protein
MPIANWAKARLHIGARTGKIGLLRQITQGDPRLQETRPAVGLDEARRDLQKCRFARTIAPDKAQALSGRDRETGGFEERRAAEGQRNILQ